MTVPEKARFFKRVWTKSNSESKSTKIKFSRMSNTEEEGTKAAGCGGEYCKNESAAHEEPKTHDQLIQHLLEAQYLEIPFVSINNEHGPQPGSPPKSVSFGKDKIVVFQNFGLTEKNQNMEDNVGRVLKYANSTVHEGLQLVQISGDCEEEASNECESSLLGETESQEAEDESSQDVSSSISFLLDDPSDQKIHTLRSQTAVMQMQSSKTNGEDIRSFENLNSSKNLQEVSNFKSLDGCTPCNVHPKGKEELAAKYSSQRVNGTKNFVHEESVSIDDMFLPIANCNALAYEQVLFKKDSPNAVNLESEEAIQKGNIDLLQENSVETNARNVDQGFEAYTFFNDFKTTTTHEASNHGNNFKGKRVSFCDTKNVANIEFNLPSTPHSQSDERDRDSMNCQWSNYNLRNVVEEVPLQTEPACKAADYEIESEQFFDQDMEQLRREQQTLQTHTAEIASETDSGNERRDSISYENDLLRFELATLRNRCDVLTNIKRQEIREIEQKLLTQIEECKDLRQRNDFILEDFARISLRATCESRAYTELLGEVKQLRREVQIRSMKTEESMRNFQELENYYKDYIIALGQAVNIACKYLEPISCEAYSDLFRLMSHFNVKYPTNQEQTNLRELLPLAMKATITGYIDARNNRVPQNCQPRRALKARKQKIRSYKYLGFSGGENSIKHPKCRGLKGLSLAKSLGWQRVEPQ